MNQQLIIELKSNKILVIKFQKSCGFIEILYFFTQDSIVFYLNFVF